MNTKIETWHLKSPAETLKIFQTRKSGLTADEVKARLIEHGPNKLPEGKTDGLPVIFLRQFQYPQSFSLDCGNGGDRFALFDCYWCLGRQWFKRDVCRSGNFVGHPN